jgi:hypothetical protein
MIILSKHKDYYDHLAGVYGIDEKIVLDRRVCHRLKLDDYEYSDRDRKLVVDFCGIRYIGLWKSGKFYWGDKIKQFALEPRREMGKRGVTWKYMSREYWRGDETMYTVYMKDVGFGTPQYTRFPVNPKKVKTNELANCPILFSNTEETNPDAMHRFPILKDMGFGSVISPEDAWIQISNFMSRNIVIPNKQTDKENNISHGFDYKKSFRKEKKDA